MRTEIMRRRVRTLTIREAERLDHTQPRLTPNSAGLPVGQPG
jgi:heme exporter protein C